MQLKQLGRIMSKWLGYANVIALIIVSGALYYFSQSNTSRINILANQIAGINDGAKAAEARQEIRNFLTLNSIPYSRALCSKSDSKNENQLCKTLVFKRFSNLSDSTDLWVAIDAITVFADVPNLPTSLRREVTRYYSDLVSSLEMDGALSFVSRNDEIKYMISANNIYQAIVAQSSVCSKMPQYRKCSNGLTKETNISLKALTDIVMREGAKFAPFEMSNRIESVKALYSTGVLANET